MSKLLKVIQFRFLSLCTYLIIVRFKRILVFSVSIEKEKMATAGPKILRPKGFSLPIEPVLPLNIPPQVT
jgi:hypothetical protein